MKATRRVLHLSIALAMSLPLFNGPAWSDESPVAEVPDESVTESPDALPQGTQSMFQNAGESDRLRHRVGENEQSQARRSRLESDTESSADDAGSTAVRDPLLATDHTPAQDRDRTRDQLQDDSLDYEQTRQRARDRLTDEAQTEPGFENPYQFGNSIAGQGFNTSGSMYRGMAGNRRSSGVSSTRGTTQSGGHGHGNGNGRR